MTARVGLIGLGTYQLGDEARRVCDDALELGYRHIDTASLYGNEQAVGDAVRASGIDRSEVTITSKVWVDDIRSGRIEEAVERSAARLGQIDAMLLHAPVGDAAKIDRSWRQLLSACETHGIATAGVSNYRQLHLDALHSHPAINQIEVSPFLPRTELVEHCQGLGIEVTAHSPLVKGRRLEDTVVSQVASEIDVDGVPATPAQVLLAWSIAHGLTPLPRSRSRERLAENLKAGHIVLTPSQLARLAELADGYATHPQHR